jgi:hypothetical protein
MLAIAFVAKKRLDITCWSSCSLRTAERKSVVLKSNHFPARKAGLLISTEE